MNLRAEVRRMLVYRLDVLGLLRFWLWRTSALSDIPSSRPADTTAIVLSYKRPQNMETIVRLLLASPSIGRVLLSNNNPDIRMRDWVSLQDSRLTVIDQAMRQCTHMRFGLAEREASRMFLCIDDDLFVTPRDIERLLAHLRDDPSSPCGFFGQTRDAETGIWAHNVQGDGVVDSLNRIYAFTKDHVRTFFRLIDKRGMTPIHPLWSGEAGNWFDDILLSASGIGRARICRAGMWLDCPTSSARNIAVWRHPGFFAFRECFFNSVHA